MHLTAFFLICLLPISTILAQMQLVVNDTQGNGNIDWANHAIIATGIGAPNPDLPQAAQQPAALRAAQQSALQNALETIKGMYINSSTTGEKFMNENGMVLSNVDGYLVDMQQHGNKKQLSDGIVEITMKVPLDGVGGISDLLLGNIVASQPSIRSFEKGSDKKESIFTGLVIDCSKLPTKPALSPRILDENKREVYSSAYVSRDWAIKYGIVGYAKEIQTALQQTERIGSNPGQIKARKVTGINSTDIVISNKDAEIIRSSPKNLKALSECRVIFVIN